MNHKTFKITVAATLLASEPNDGCSIRTWAIFDEYGYIPTGIGCQTAVAGTKWDAFSDTGGYAHLISAASQWVLYLEGKRDGEVHMLGSRETKE